jgi:O-antigen/teichoic acid export membrane protein
MSGRLSGLLRGTLIYGVGQALSRSMTLLLVPVLTAYLDPASYGILAVLTAFGLLLNTVFSVGLGAATAPSYFEKEQKGPTIWTAFAILCVSTAIMLAVCLAFAPAIAQLILHDREYGRMVSLSAGATAFSILAIPLRQFLMFEERPLLYVSVSMGSLIVSLGLTVWAVAGLHRGVAGVLEADLIAQAVTCALLVVPVLRHARFEVRPRLARELIALGLPLIPAFGSVFVLQHGSRYILQWLRGPGEVGLYALGVNLAGAVGLFVAGFQSAWMPYFMRFSQRRDEAVHAFGRVATYYVISVGAASLLMYLFAKPAVMLLSGPEYRRAELVVGMAASAQFLSGAFLVLVPGLYFAREVQYVGALQALAAIAAVGLNFLLVPRFGSVGSAAAVLFSYVLLNLAQLWWNRRRRYLEVAYDWRRLGRFAVVYASVAAVTFVPRDLSVAAELAISSVGAMLLGAAIWRLLNHDERVRLRMLAAAAFAVTANAAPGVGRGV